jgi:alpha-D-xyloside xylohydrolase
MYFDHDEDGNCISINTNDIDASESFIRNVYLPEGCNWYNYNTGDKYEGGQYIKVEALLDTIPVFVKEGTIIPVTAFERSTQEQTGDITLHIFGGADAFFSLYEDEGDGYGYEKGDYTITKIEYIDSQNKVLADGALSDRFKVEIIK